MSGESEQHESLIESDVRMMFRQGQYAEAVPFIQAHLKAVSDDIPAYELMAKALKFSGDKAGAAGALITAGELYGQAGHTIQALAAQKKAADLGVEPDFAAARPAGAPPPAELEFEAEPEEDLGLDIGSGLDMGPDLDIGADLGLGGESSTTADEAAPEATPPAAESSGGFDLGVPEEPAQPEPGGGFDLGVPEEPAQPEPGGGFDLGVPEEPAQPEPGGGFDLGVPEEPAPAAPAAPADAPAPAAGPAPSGRVRTPLFDSLSDEEFLEVAAGLTARDYDEGEDVVVEGEPGDSMFIIAKGRVAVLVEKGEGHAELAELGPGDFFGEAALLTKQPRSATCRARTPTDCLVLSRSALDVIVAKFPRVAEIMERFNDERADSTIDSLIDFLGD